MSHSEKPVFKAGKNLAMKVPPELFAETVAFYQSILGLPLAQLETQEVGDSVVFDFDGKNLWIDSREGISRAEIWLEIVADDVAAADSYLTAMGCVRCDDVEMLPPGFNGFWIRGPGSVIHLIN